MHMYIHVDGEVHSIWLKNSYVNPIFLNVDIYCRHVARSCSRVYMSSCKYEVFMRLSLAILT